MAKGGRLTDTPTDRRLKFILEAYLELLFKAHRGETPVVAGVDPVAESFRVGDLLRGGAVQRSLSASAARFAIRNPELSELERREQDSKWQADGLTATLAVLTEQGVLDAAEIATYRGRIENLRLARVALIAEISNQFPEYASLSAPATDDFTVQIQRGQRSDGPCAGIAVHAARSDRVRDEQGCLETQFVQLCPSAFLGAVFALRRWGETARFELISSGHS